MSPTALSLRLLRQTGYTAAVVESWVPVANIRRDLFGVADVLAVNPIRKDLLLVQATSLSNVSARVHKAQRSVELLAALRAGLRYEIWGWHQRAGRWDVRRVELTGDELAASELTPRRRRGRRRMEQAELFSE